VLTTIEQWGGFSAAFCGALVDAAGVKIQYLPMIFHGAESTQTADPVARRLKRAMDAER
jgi:hypothetical protein